MERKLFERIMVKVSKRITICLFLLFSCTSYQETAEYIDRNANSNKYSAAVYNKVKKSTSEKIRYNDNYDGEYSNYHMNRNKRKNRYGLFGFGRKKQERAVKNEIRYTKSRSGKYEGHYKIGKPYTILGQTYHPKPEEDYKETGVASWYGKKFYGKKTANGEVYDMYDMTAAHRTLPLPSVVKVTNLENGKSVKVRVNDRGPFAKNRIIDVSKAVAQKLAFHNKGTTKVKVEYLPRETNRMLREYGLIQ